MKQQFVKDLKSNVPVNDIFYVTRRTIKEKRNGEPFITFEFQDRTGKVAGIMWDQVEDALQCVEASGFYHVEGKLGDYQGRPQLTVNAIYPAAPEEVRRDDFVPVTRYDRQQLLTELQSYITEVQTPHFRGLLDSFFAGKEFTERFAAAPAAAQVHHAYLGGLLEHTVFMCRAAKALAGIYEEIDRDLLMTGIILHDVGKTGEYHYETAIEHTYDGRLIGHIVLGYQMVRDRIAGSPGFPEEPARMLLHIILSHHGLMEFGSPKTPKFVEALVVHFLDNLDARVMMFREAVEKNPGTKWTDFHQFLETNVYIRDPEE